MVLNIITLFISWKHLSNIVITFIDYYVEKNYRSQMLMIEVLLGKPVIYIYYICKCCGTVGER